MGSSTSSLLTDPNAQRIKKTEQCARKETPWTYINTFTLRIHDFRDCGVLNRQCRRIPERQVTSPILQSSLIQLQSQQHFNLCQHSSFPLLVAQSQYERTRIGAPRLASDSMNNYSPLYRPCVLELMLTVGCQCRSKTSFQLQALGFTG